MPADDAAPTTITLYWRPACGFCSRLRRDLDGSGLPIDEVDIWEQPEGATVVRSVANGNETVPTLVIDAPGRPVVGLVNPSAREVFAAVAEHAPQLLPPTGS